MVRVVSTSLVGSRVHAQVEHLTRGWAIQKDGHEIEPPTQGKINKNKYMKEYMRKRRAAKSKKKS